MLNLLKYIFRTSILRKENRAQCIGGVTKTFVLGRVEWGNTPTLRKNQQYFFGTKFNETILIPTCQVKTIIQITCKNKHALYKKKTKFFKK